MVLKTRLTEMLGIEHPIIQGGMQYVGYAEMASAVSNAGGLGVLTGLTQPSPEDLRAEIRRCRQMTSKPFGVNLTILPALIPADYDGYVDVVAEERVALLEVAGASPKKYMKQLHAAGVRVLHKSATLRHALKAQEAGVDLIEIVGYEASIAGGQPGDEVGLWVVLPRAVPLLSVPVIASGASATGRQLAAALSMGAQGITMATRFLCTVEAPIHHRIKEHMARPDVDERSTTVVLRSLNNATRVFKNDVSTTMNRLDEEMQGNVDFSKIAPYASGVRTKKMWQETGDWNDSMWSCGQSVGLINDIPTCKDLLAGMVAEAEAQLTLSAACVAAPSKL
jgi:nitronate monooxygenase